MFPLLIKAAKTKRIKWFANAFLLVLVITFLFWNQSPPRSEHKQHAPPTPSRGGAPHLLLKKNPCSEKLRLVTQWPFDTGSYFVYDYFEQIDFQSSEQTIPTNSRQQSDLTLQATLELAMLERQSAANLFYLRFSVDEYQAEHDPLGIAQQIKEFKQTDAFALIDAQGQLIVLVTHPGDKLKSFWSRITERLQLRLPKDVSNVNWQHKEKFNGQSQLFDYHLSKSPSETCDQERNLLLVKRAKFEHENDFSFSNQVSISADFSRIEAMRIDELTTTKSKFFSFRSKNAVALHFRWRKMMMPDTIDALLEQYEKLRREEPRLSNANDEAFDEARLHRNELGGMSYAQLRNRWQKSKRFNIKHYLKAKAWIFLHPDQLNQLKIDMEHWDPEGDRFKLWSQALSAVGHPQAQALLSDLLNQHLDNESVAINLITNLAQVESYPPSSVSEQTLQATAQAKDGSLVAKSADLALGVFANKMQQSGDPEQQNRAREIHKAFEKELSPDESIDSILHKLSVLGNIGSSESFELIAPYVYHSSEKVRAHAVEALRLIWIDPARNLLLTRLEVDQSPRVRRTAAASLAYYPLQLDAIERTTNLALKEGEVGVRMAIYSMLGKSSRSFPKQVEHFFKLCLSVERVPQAIKMIEMYLAKLNADEADGLPQ